MSNEPVPERGAHRAGYWAGDLDVSAFTLPLYEVISGATLVANPPEPPPGGFCRVYWGSHGCDEPRGHPPEAPHACDCCQCENHPDPDPDNPGNEPSCVARPPYYGPGTRFFGEDC